MSAPPALSVVQLYDAAIASDIAGSLRRSAESVEAETEGHDRTVAMITVQVHESGHVAVYGWGRTDRFRAMGALMVGVGKVEGWAEPSS